MNLIELRDKLNKEIEQGFGYIPVLVWDGDSGYEESRDIEFEKSESGYMIY